MRQARAILAPRPRHDRAEQAVTGLQFEPIAITGTRSRAAIEAHIERMIAYLDAIDGDADMEDSVEDPAGLEREGL